MLRLLRTMAIALQLALALHAGAVIAQSTAAQGLAPPSGSSVDRLGETIVDGRPMTIEHVMVPQAAAEVLRHYRRALAAGSSGKIIERKLMGDQILARKINESFVTVRVRSTLDGGSDVWVMTTPMQPPTLRSEPPPHLALPAGSRVLSNVETVDGARRAHTVIATAEAGIAATQDFLKQSLGERGFTLVASDAASNNPARRVLLFQRGTEDVMVTIADGPTGRTMVLNASAPK